MNEVELAEAYKETIKKPQPQNELGATKAIQGIETGADSSKNSTWVDIIV